MRSEEWTEQSGLGGEQREIGLCQHPIFRGQSMVFIQKKTGLGEEGEDAVIEDTAKAAGEEYYFNLHIVGLRR